MGRLPFTDTAHVIHKTTELVIVTRVEIMQFKGIISGETFIPSELLGIATTITAVPEVFLELRHQEHTGDLLDTAIPHLPTMVFTVPLDMHLAQASYLATKVSVLEADSMVLSLEQPAKET